MVFPDVMWDMSLVGLSLTVFTLLNIVIRLEKTLADLLLIIWLLLLSFPLQHAALNHFDISAQAFNHYTNPALNLLHGPILLFYVMTLSRMTIKLNWRLLFHFLPFVVMYLVFIASEHSMPMQQGDFAPLAPNQNIESMKPPLTSSELMFPFNYLLVNFGFINALSFIAYSGVVVSIILQHQTKVESYFSYHNHEISLKWVCVLPVFFISLTAFNIVNNSNLGLFETLSPQFILLFSNVLFIVMLCFFGIRQKTIFKENKLENQQHSATAVEVESLSTNAEPNSTIQVESEIIVCEESNDDSSSSLGLSEQAINDVVAQMQAHMQHHKPYLDPSFSVYDLASSLQLPRRTLSHVLSHGVAKNFFQYVNEYRIEEVKNRLVSQQQESILDIAFESGFNSKSSFNSIFKKYCDVTPSAYRKQALAEQAA